MEIRYAGRLATDGSVLGSNQPGTQAVPLCIQAVAPCTQAPCSTACSWRRATPTAARPWRVRVPRALFLCSCTHVATYTRHGEVAAIYPRRVVANFSVQHGLLELFQMLPRSFLSDERNTCASSSEVHQGELTKRAVKCHLLAVFWVTILVRKSGILRLKHLKVTY